MGYSETVLLVAISLLAYEGNISCSSGHCSNEASDDAPAILECSEYHLCDAIAGDTLEIPCGGIEEASFTYRIISNLFAIESEITLNQFLIMNVTASDNEKHVMCLPNNTQDHYCYKLQIEYPPQESEGGALQQVGIRNNRYCLGCQLESNPPPTCNWTVYSFSVPPSPLSCYWDPSTCDVVSDPPGGVSFPRSPEDECNDVCDDTSQLPPPVYPGCVIKIEHLTEQYSTEPLGIMCTAENAHGESTVNFGSIPVSNCDGEVSDVRLSPFGPRIDLTVGDIETINCTASNAEPDSRVALYHNGTRVLDNTLHSYDPVACIRQISLLLNGTIDSDAGDYTCVYNQGNILWTSSVSVTVMPVPKDEPRGQQSIIMPVLAAGGSTVVLIITLAIFLMMYLASNSIKYYLKWRLREPEYVYLIKGVEKKYVFDVFLSFADEDKEATERLIKEPLETRGYEVCWHHEDFMPGKTISENIDDNIRDSRKVLFVLSEDFFKSLHCVRELDTSIRKLKKTKTRCVVPILLRDCERLLPTDIKDLTYLDARSINEEKLITTTCVILGKPLRDIGFSSTIFSSDPEI